MKLIVTGATGLVGAEVIRQAIADPGITEVIALARKPIDMGSPKVRSVIHSDFLKYEGLDELFKSADGCAWCLGISQAQVTKAEYRVITHDYALNAAKAMTSANPNLKFLFVSGMGADSTEKTSSTFGRVKGETENALIRLGLKHLYIVRPGGIQPITPNPNAPFAYKLMNPLFPLLKLLMPTGVITSVQLARVILSIVKEGMPEQLRENKALLQLSNERRLMGA